MLFIKAIEKAYPVYKNEYGEEPDIDFDPEFSVLISRFLVQFLKMQYDAFFIEEDADENGFVISANFYPLKEEARFILIKDVSEIVYF